MAARMKRAYLNRFSQMSVKQGADASRMNEALLAYNKRAEWRDDQWFRLFGSDPFRGGNGRIESLIKLREMLKTEDPVVNNIRMFDTPRQVLFLFFSSDKKRWYFVHIFRGTTRISRKYPSRFLAFHAYKIDNIVYEHTMD